jgi:hypothetical protein
MGTRKEAARLRRDDDRLSDQQRRFEASGQSVAAFCRAEGIPVSTFYQRRARLKKQGRQRRNGNSAGATMASFIDAGALVVSAPARPAALPLQATELRDGVEVRIDLGGGVVVRVARA